MMIHLRSASRRILSSKILSASSSTSKCMKKSSISSLQLVVGGGSKNDFDISKGKRQYTTHSQLPEEHQMIYEMCRKFADEELAPNAGKWDQEHAFPTDAVSQLVSI